MSSSMSFGSATSRARTAGDSVSGRVAATISCSASVIRPRPISTRPKRADAAVLARDEDDDADEDQERRQPRQVEREHDRHQAGADVGAEHHRQRGAGRDQVLADEGGDDQAGGGARLHQAGHAEAGDQGAEAVAEAVRQDAAQVLAEHAQHAGADDVRAPDQQGDRGEEVEEVDQVWLSTRSKASKLRQRRSGSTSFEAAVDDQRHPLLGDAAVRAQRHLERRRGRGARPRCRSPWSARRRRRGRRCGRPAARSSAAASSRERTLSTPRSAAMRAASAAASRPRGR